MYINNWMRGLRNIVAGTLTLCALACESKVEDPNAAFEDAKMLRTTQSDSVAIATEADALRANAKPELKNSSIPRPKVTIIDPWIAYARGIEARLLVNDATIKSLKSLASNARNYKKIAALEKENSEFRQQMLAYKAEETARWAEFKTKMDNQVDLLEIGLKELNPALQ